MISCPKCGGRVLNVFDEAGDPHEDFRDKDEDEDDVL